MGLKYTVRIEKKIFIIRKKQYKHRFHGPLKTFLRTFFIVFFQNVLYYQFIRIKKYYYKNAKRYVRIQMQFFG